jgi:hypothetical protein
MTLKIGREMPGYRVGILLYLRFSILRELVLTAIINPHH